MSFQDRRDSFEKEMAHKEELAFKIKMRRTKLAAQQVAAKASIADADGYAMTIVGWFVENMDDNALVERFQADARQNGLTLSAEEVTALLQLAHAEADRQLKNR